MCACFRYVQGIGAYLSVGGLLFNFNHVYFFVSA